MTLSLQILQLLIRNKIIRNGNAQDVKVVKGFISRTEFKGVETRKSKYRVSWMH